MSQGPTVSTLPWFATHPDRAAVDEFMRSIANVDAPVGIPLGSVCRLEEAAFQSGDYPLADSEIVDELGYVRDTRIGAR